MPLKNFSNIGELQEYEFITGEIVSLDYENDTCEIIIEGDTKTGVPIFYHCNPSAQERSNGAVQGGAFGFAKKDKVVVMRQQKPPNNMFVIGHKSGARPCKPLFIIFSSESGAEAIVWDILHDEIVIELSTLSTVQSTLIRWGVTEQTKCEPDDLRVYCFYNPFIEPKQLESDLPVMFTDSSESPPFITGSHQSITILDYPDEGHTCATTNHLAQSYYTNPISTKDQTPRPGMWVVTISGVILASTWNTQEWGTMPLGISYEQYPGDPAQIEQQYIFFRSIFDYRFNGGSIVYPDYSTDLTINNLSLGAETLFIGTRDGEYFDITTIDLQTWIDAGLSESSYNFYMGLTGDPHYITGQCLPCSIMWDKSTGIATHGTTDNKKTSLLFEYVSVYPSIYDFFDKNQTWDSTMVAKLKQVLRIYYRHPYYKNNKDSILFKTVNDARASLSIEPLELNWNLYNSAQVFSDDMANRKSLVPQHVGSDGSTTIDRTVKAGYGLNTHLYTYAVGENAHTGAYGFQWQIERVVDCTDIDILQSYVVLRTNTTKDIAGSDWQLSHDNTGSLLKAQSGGWKQSPGHWANIISADFADAGLATQLDIDNNTYTTQDFGVIGNPNDFQDQKQQHWAGFASFDSTKLLEYVNANFHFDKNNDDERRNPIIYLCTITN